MAEVQHTEPDEELPPLVVTSFDHMNFLVIDDDPSYLDLIAALLKSASVGGINKVLNAATAVGVLADKQSAINCVICDHHMAGMTGLGLLQRIRAGNSAVVPRELPFIVVSADASANLVKAAAPLDANGFIAKPISKNAVLKAIHLAFGRPLRLRPAADYARVAIPGG